MVSVVLLLGAGSLGEPPTLDWVDARHSDYLTQIASPSGEWEHTTTPGMTARGSSGDDLVQHLGAIHGTLSIADLHVPGRRRG